MESNIAPYKVSRPGNVLSKLLGKRYLLVLILSLTFLCYVKVLFAEFLFYDDDVLLVNNAFIKNLNLELLKGSFGFTKITHYHPLVFLSFAAEYLFFGLNPFYYHLTNVLLHLLNSLLIFLLLKKIGLNDFVSYSVLILFAFHPLHVESVAWVTERKDLLYSAFYISSLLFYVKWSDEKYNKYYYAALILFIFSCLSKSMAVTLPFVLVLINYYKTGNLKNEIKKIIPFAFISIIFIIINLVVAFYNKEMNNYNAGEMLLLICYSLIFYPFKILFPANLSSIYVYPESIGLIHYLSPVILFTLILLFIYYKNRTSRFGILFFLITIIPVLPVIPFGISITADRFVYMPSAGLFIALSFGMYSIYRLISNIRYRCTYAFCLFFLGAALAILTYNRCSKWQNTETLMNDALDYNPGNYYAYFILGNYYTSRKSYMAAISNYQHCIYIKPDYTNALMNMGNTYYLMKNFQDAINYYNKVIEIDPLDMEAYNNLGVVYEYSGELEKAIEYYKKSAQLGYEPAIYVLKYYGRDW